MNYKQYRKEIHDALVINQVQSWKCATYYGI